MSCFLKQNSIVVLVLLLILTFSPFPAFCGKCNKEDKKVLQAINAHFGFPYHFASWTNDSACCDWYDVDCDSNGRVIALTVFQDTALNGTIPEAIGDLPYLQNLEFHKLPQLVGSIPSSITKLTHLTQLDLSWNSLSGPIPSFLSELTSLTYLGLDFNQFSGSIPPSLSNLRNLIDLHLDRNMLTGSIPESFGSFPLNSPPALYLSHNNLSGPIPSALGVPQWPVIDLSRNKLTGSAAALFGASKATTQLDISRNQFAFNLTDVTFPVNATFMDLNHNMIYGEIPAQINELASLYAFNISYNRLCGEIPPGSVAVKFDQSSYFHNKCLCGAPLPPCMSMSSI